MATLTYVYADQTAVLGPLATYAEPHTYDMCAGHAERLTVPQGWSVVRLLGDLGDPAYAQAPVDDLAALADAVRETAAPHPGDATATHDPVVGRDPASSSARRAEQRANRRAHLRLLRDG